MVFAPSHPRAHVGKDRRGYVLEHILIAEQKIGRSLAKGEVVHHINGNKKDNSPENLEVMDSFEHRLLHARRGSAPCRFCGKI